MAVIDKDGVMSITPLLTKSQRESTIMPAIAHSELGFDELDLST
jgi:hypothetical protein